MPETIRYFDANWNPVASETEAAFRLVVVTDVTGAERYTRRETIGPRKDKQTFSTDPRAGGIMKEHVANRRPTPMSRPRV